MGSTEGSGTKDKGQKGDRVGWTQVGSESQGGNVAGGKLPSDFCFLPHTFLQVPRILSMTRILLFIRKKSLLPENSAKASVMMSKLRSRISALPTGVRAFSGSADGFAQIRRCAAAS